MILACRPGQTSISSAWVSDTNAPEAGKKTVKAHSNTANDRAPATAARDRIKTMPPPSTASRRRLPSPASTPNGSSSAPPASSGTDASKPTCA